MARIAPGAKLARVNGGLAVAGTAFLRRAGVGAAAVARLAGQPRVCATEGKGYQAVIETGAAPAVRRVALLAAPAELPGMRVAVQMAGLA